MAPTFKDILYQTGAIGVAIIIAAILRWFIDPKLEIALGIAAIGAATAVVKHVRPAHFALRGASWLYLALVWSIFIAMAVLLGNHAILGYWTIPTAVCLGLLYCVVHLVFGPREDDARARRR